MKESDLKKEVELLIGDVDKTHRYSMSKIYELSNRVFQKQESSQSCASCLIRKVRELRKWLESRQMDIEPEEVKKKPTRKKKGAKNGNEA